MYSSQLELEAALDRMSAARAAHNLARNEEAGHAERNQYAKALYRRFVSGVAEAITLACDLKGPGRARAHVSLLRDLPDPEAVAVIAMTHAINGAIGRAKARDVALAIGRAVHGELFLAQFEELSPDLYHTLVEDLRDRMSKDERHRLTIFRLQAEKNGFNIDKWSTESKHQIGFWLLDVLVELGMLSIFEVISERKRGRQQYIRFSEDVEILVTELKEQAIQRSVVRTPFISPPLQWQAPNDGGFHTPQMRKRAPFAIRAMGNMRAWYLDNPLACAPILETLNSLQLVRWQVNEQIAQIAQALYDEGITTEEIPAKVDAGKPQHPHHDGWDKDTASPEELEVFRQWKRAMAQWYSDLKKRGSKYIRFAAAMRDAKEFACYPALYFRYTADFRGRVYAESSGVSPQGSDLQKALLRFADGSSLRSEDARFWFLVNGANRFGYDKASLHARAAWSKNNEEMILKVAGDPIENREWLQADSPFQFLAWCLEYRAWREHGDTFVSRIPIGMDGSCNGLQNYSAMLRDEVGAMATNLIPAEERQDIYDAVARRATELMLAAEPDPAGFRARWLAHGINRKVTKRISMCLPYGAARHSCTRFILEEYVGKGLVPEFERSEYGKAAAYVADFVWDAIGDVVVKAREAMAWLQQSTRQILKSGVTEIAWTTPLGSRVAQGYTEQEEVRVRCRLLGDVTISTLRPKDGGAPDVHRHANGIAPNMIHSVDASHMALVVRACMTAGITQLAMIHDDFGTTAADCAALYRVIREQFVAMHSSRDPLHDFYMEYATFGISPPPTRGGLDINLVLNSEYFFA